MDSGMLEAEYESFNALQPRLPEEVIGIMDQLLSHEASNNSRSKLCLWTKDSFFKIDGMAYGKCPLTDFVHLPIYRQASFLEPENTRRGNLCKSSWNWCKHRYERTTIVRKCAETILPGSHQVLLLRQPTNIDGAYLRSS